MNPLTDFQLRTTRRDLLNNSSRAVGAAALASLIGESATPTFAATDNGRGGLPGLPHFAPRAKR
ncbi:MAG: sulfatase, partial [Planctomycetota bacterium]|nr:sulfatase [Planctomycetota bacterium]